MTTALDRRSIAIKQILEFRSSARLEQSRRQQNSCLLRVELIGGDQDHLSSSYFYVAAKGSSHSRGASDNHNALLSLRRLPQPPEKLDSCCHSRPGDNDSLGTLGHRHG